MKWKLMVGSKARATKMGVIFRIIGVLWIGILGLSEAHAFANNTTARSTITNLVFYTSYDTGDVTFSLAASGITSCAGGFWIRGTDAGARNVLAALLTASQTGATIIVDTDTTQLWAGSATPTCLVWDIRF